jgi:hypothetical protein
VTEAASESVTYAIQISRLRSRPEPSSSSSEQRVPVEIPAQIQGYGPATHPGGTVTEVSEMTALIAGTESAPKYTRDNHIMLICRAKNDKVDFNTDTVIDKSELFVLPTTQVRINVTLSNDTLQILKDSLFVEFYLAMVPSHVHREDIKTLTDVVKSGGRFLDTKGLGLIPMTLPTRPPEPQPGPAPEQLPIRQDCGGGNCAASVGQQGGVTAGQINVDTDRHLSPKQIADIGTAKTTCTTMPFVNVTASSDEAKRYAYEFIGALRDAGCHADLILPIPSLRPDMVGIFVRVRDVNQIDPSATALGEVLSKANVSFVFRAMDADFFPGAAFVLVVGAKQSPSAASINQQGGITAGQITVNAAEHQLSVTRSVEDVPKGSCPAQDVNVSLNNANDETGKFGDQLKLALEHTGMQVKLGPVIAFGADGPIPRGVVLDAGDNCLDMANNIAAALASNHAVSTTRLRVTHVTSSEWKDRLSVMISPPN